MDGPGEVTLMLQRLRVGDQDARNALYELLYSDLRRIARTQLRNEHCAFSLQPTALVNEAYLRLAGAELDMESRGQFMAVVAQVMRRILVDHARARRAEKRGAGLGAVELDEGVARTLPKPEHVLALDEALDRLQGLQELDERKCRVVELRYFGGCTEEETAAALGVNRQTVTRDWRFARAFLLDAMQSLRKEQ
jgi:RNA polymerase sigma-70 factor, ECF subfamily